MSKIIKFYFFICILFLLPSAILAQKVEGNALIKLTPVKVPDAYKSPTGKLAPANAPVLKNNSKPYSANFWIVYSDRDNNKTYKDKNCSVQLSTISFKQAFYVADQTDNAIRLVFFNNTDDAVNEVKGKAVFLSTAEDAGWILKKNLLLWSVCLNDSSGGRYSRKAVAIKRIKDFENFAKATTRGILDFYNSSVKSEEDENDRDIKLFQYLYIYKEENGMLLLGNTNILKVNTISSNLYGWAEKSKVQEWPSAICLRVNFDEQAIAERKKGNIDPEFYQTEGQAIEYLSGKKGVEGKLLYFYNDPSENNDKDNPYLLGYPIISSTKDQSVFRTGYVTNIVDKNGKNIFTALKGADIDKKKEDIKKARRKINIVFVLDGDATTRKFYDKLAAAVDNVSAIGDKTLTNNDYQLAAVIYNDESCGENAFTKIRFSTNKERFVERLKEEALKPLGDCQVNRSNGAPLNDAIKIAADFFDNDKTTNVIVIAGSQTDDDLSKRDVAMNSLLKKDVQLVCYQLTNKNNTYYDNFIRNLKYFLEKLSEAADKDLTKEILANKFKKGKMICEGESCRLSNSQTIGEGFFKDDNRQFQPQELNANLKKLLTSLENKINKTIDILDNSTTGSSKGTSLEKTVEEDMKRCLSWLYAEGLTDEIIEKISTMENFQLFFEGYTALKPKTVTNPIFERTLFVAENEFQRLYESIETVVDGITQTQRREGVVNACRDIIFTYKGEMDEKQKESYSLEEVYFLITNLKGSTNNPIFKKSLKDLKDEKKTTSDEIDRMYNSFKLVLERLKQLKRSPLSKYEQDFQLFYWVPESKLTLDE